MAGVTRTASAPKLISPIMPSCKTRFLVAARDLGKAFDENVVLDIRTPEAHSPDPPAPARGFASRLPPADYAPSNSRRSAISTPRASPLSRAATRDSAERRPCRQRALRDCSKPVAVFGPVLAPPCIRHRPAAIAGPLQDRPLRHRAPQRGAAFAASSAICHDSAPGVQGSLRGIVVSLCKGSPGCRDGTCDDRLAAGDAAMLHRKRHPTTVPHPQNGH